MSPQAMLPCLVTAFLCLWPAPAAAQDDPAHSAVRVVPLHLKDIGIDGLAPTSPLAIPEPNYRNCLRRLHDLAGDPTVQGVRLYLDGGLDLARAREYLKALRQVKRAGKRIVCYTEDLDAGSLLFGSVADHLVMPPSGIVMLQGPIAEALYLKGLLAKLGVRFEVMHIGDFKTAYEDMALDRMSDAQRETIQAIVDEYFQEVVRTVADQRGLTEAQVVALYDRWMLSPEELRQAGVLDAVAFEDEFEAQVEGLFGQPVELDRSYGREEEEEMKKLLENPLALFAALPRLMEGTPEELPPGPKIAIVYANGQIMSGKSTSGLTGSVMGSETIVKALDQAREDEDVKAVVFRVDSPGGSALASDMIWRAVERVKEKKPVVASMGPVAGSGGYWISMGCHRILAQPTTITGSIGVVSAVPDLSGALDKLGVRVEVVGAGPRVQELSTLTGASPFLRERMTGYMEEVYDSFIQKVATGRSMDPAVVREIAEGRAWTGRTAKELGLIDAFGGLEDAVVVACHLAGGLDPQTVPVRELPTPPNFMEMLEEAMEPFMGLESGASVLQPLVGPLRLLGAEQILVGLEVLAEEVVGQRKPSVQAVMPFHLILH